MIAALGPAPMTDEVSRFHRLLGFGSNWLFATGRGIMRDHHPPTVAAYRREHEMNISSRHRGYRARLCAIRGAAFG
jgi:hypothetical protein